MISEYQTTSFANGNNQTYEQKVFQAKKCVLETIFKIDTFRFPSKTFYAETPITNSRTLSNSNRTNFSWAAARFLGFTEKRLDSVLHSRVFYTTSKQCFK